MPPKLAGALVLMLLVTSRQAASFDAGDTVTPEMFGAVGDGVADDTAAWMRAARSGRDITARGNYLVTDTILLATPGIKLVGPGRIIAAPTLRGKALIHSTGTDCLIQNLRLENPSGAQSEAGPIDAAIRISADRCRVIGNTIDRFQNGIVVSAEGEFFDTLIQRNVVRNVIGAGRGPRDGQSASGEDRGDGIVSWGGRTRIIDNHVSALPGTDARIGIHVEALPTYKTRPATPDDDAGAEIVGNRVEGPFRRGIANEGVRNVRITDNDLPGGYSWWGIAVTQSVSNTLVARNRVTFDRRPGNLSGAVWSPWPAAIQIAGFGAGVLIRDVAVRDNEVRVVHCGGPALQYMNSAAPAANYGPLSARGNMLVANSPCSSPAINLVGGTTLERQADNRVSGEWRVAGR